MGVFSTFLHHKFVVYDQRLGFTAYSPVMQRSLPDACPQCENAFSSIFNSTSTIFQMIFIGDGFREIAAPIIQFAPWTALIFCTMFGSIALGICNLILAAFVHSAGESREYDMQFIAHTNKVFDEHLKSRLIKLCEKIDISGGGSLSYTEIIRSYDGLPELKAVFDFAWQDEMRGDRMKEPFSTSAAIFAEQPQPKVAHCLPGSFGRRGLLPCRTCPSEKAVVYTINPKAYPHPQEVSVVPPQVEISIATFEGGSKHNWRPSTGFSTACPEDTSSHSSVSRIQL